ncbi:MAG: DUF4142 domain-containing protein [Polyangiaceae bacterium]|nr:DUF4142 domain-containing protein [Polyangiaceae bacterium]
MSFQSAGKHAPVLILALFAGCAGGTAGIEAATPAAGPVEPRLTMREQRQETLTRKEPQPLADAFTDEEVLGILDKSTDRLMAQARIAAEKASNPEVRKLASDLYIEYAAFRERQSMLANRIGLFQEDSKKRENLQIGKELDVIILLEHGPNTFDRAYLAQTISEHQDALDLVDQKILPSIDAPELRALIESDLRDALQKNLARAIDTNRTIRDNVARDARQRS